MFRNYQNYTKTAFLKDLKTLLLNSLGSLVSLYHLCDFHIPPMIPVPLRLSKYAYINLDHLCDLENSFLDILKFISKELHRIFFHPFQRLLSINSYKFFPFSNMAYLLEFSLLFYCALLSWLFICQSYSLCSEHLAVMNYPLLTSVSKTPSRSLLCARSDKLQRCWVIFGKTTY